MTNAMRFKGYFARIEFDGRDNIFVGYVLGIDEKISFHGSTVRELTVDFHAAVDHYLSDCARQGHTPHKSASGKLMLRIDPDVHARVGVAAALSDASINQWSEAVLERAAQDVLERAAASTRARRARQMTGNAPAPRRRSAAAV